jgi:hypothetical protein
MLPFTLEKGLLLEDRDVLLPWGTQWRRLADIGSPSVNESRTEILFAWQYPRFLGGLCGSVQARLTHQRPLRDLELHVGAQAETPQQTFERVSAHLRDSFDAPMRRETSKHDGYPTEEWHIPPITIWHLISERFGKYHILHVRHRGKIEHETTLPNTALEPTPTAP